MAIVPHRQLYLAALSILFIVLLLLVFISVSTYRNLDRERQGAMETVHRQALTLINALEAGARAGRLMQMAGEDAVGNLIHEIGRSPDIHYLYLVDEAGQVVHHSIPSLEGTLALWRPGFGTATHIQTRVKRLAGGTRVYEVAKPFPPRSFAREGPPGLASHGTGGAGPHFHPRTIVYLGMSMTAYETARQSDLHHAAIMAGIVLALGGGVIFFFIVIRSYYMLSRTLEETRDHTRQIIASMAHGVMSIDTEGIVVSHNPQAASLLGIAPKDMKRLDLRAVFNFDDTGIDRTLDQGVPVLNHEIQFDQPSGNTLPLMLTVTPIGDESGSRTGAVVVIRDMRAIKQLEAQVQRAEKLAVVGRLAAGVAHEIRNPLSSIRGFAYLLGRNHGKETPEREYADVMVREIDRINHVVTDLLNFARPMTLVPEATRIDDLIGHVVSLVTADAKRQRIDIHVDVAPDLPAMSLDPNQITQALLNLMLNAIHALENGGGVTVRAGRRKGGNGASITFEDNGPGIARDLQEKIFEPFFTTRERGTGLGLAMVRKIAENHDGSVDLRSPPPGKSGGTRFTLNLGNMAT
jgi:two-component system, NtrC family, sensor histidine kinase HydH